MANANAAAAPATPAEPPAEGGKSRKKLILVTAVVLAITGGTAAYFHQGDGAAAGEKAAAAEKAEHKLPAQYIALDPPFVVNFDAGSSARFLQVAVQLMTRDLETVEFLKQHDPVIRNDLLLLLGNVRYEDVQTREGKEALLQSSLEAVRKILKAEGAKPEKVEAVYFTSFVMQ